MHGYRCNRPGPEKKSVRKRRRGDETPKSERKITDFIRVRILHLTASVCKTISCIYAVFRFSMRLLIVLGPNESEADGGKFKWGKLFE